MTESEFLELARTKQEAIRRQKITIKDYERNAEEKERTSRGFFSTSLDKEDVAFARSILYRERDKLRNLESEFSEMSKHYREQTGKDLNESLMQF